MKGYHQKREGDIALKLPFFNGKSISECDEVTFGQWLSAVEGAQQLAPPLLFIVGYKDLQKNQLHRLLET